MNVLSPEQERERETHTCGAQPNIFPAPQTTVSLLLIPLSRSLSPFCNRAKNCTTNVREQSRTTKSPNGTRPYLHPCITSPSPTFKRKRVGGWEMKTRADGSSCRPRRPANSSFFFLSVLLWCLQHPSPRVLLFSAAEPTWQRLKSKVAIISPICPRPPTLVDYLSAINESPSYLPRQIRVFSNKQRFASYVNKPPLPPRALLVLNVHDVKYTLLSSVDMLYTVLFGVSPPPKWFPPPTPPFRPGSIRTGFPPGVDEKKKKRVSWIPPRGR